MRKQTPESNVLEALCEYLSARGYFFWRQNNGGVWNGSRFLPLPKYGMAGVSDLIVLHEGKAIFIEAKSDKGVQSPAQKEFQHFVETAGCTYFIARSIDHLTEAGL